MGKIFLLISAIFSLLFTSCTKEENASSGIQGGTAYSGDLLGVWSMTEDGEDYSATLKFSFFSDGGMNWWYCLSDYVDGETYTETNNADFLFYISEDILACKLVSALGDYNEEDIGAYQYIKVLENTSKTLKIRIMETYEYCYDLDFDMAEDYFNSHNDGFVYNLTKK